MFVDISMISTLHVISKESKFLVFNTPTTFQEHTLVDLIGVEEGDEFLQSA
jgi:hypothetical protein